MDFPPSAAEATGTLQVVGPGSVAPFQTVTMGPLDMRQFQAFYLQVTAVVQNTATVFNSIQVGMEWFYDAPATQICYNDVNVFIADWNTPDPFFFQGGPLLWEDACHGPFLKVLVLPSGNDLVTVTIRIVGTSRQIATPYIRQVASTDGIICQQNSVSLAAGAQQQFPCTFSYGRVWMHLAVFGTGTGASGTFFIDACFTGNLDTYVQAGGNFRFEMVIPKQALLVTVRNSGTINPNSFSIVIVSQFDKV